MNESSRIRVGVVGLGLIAQAVHLQNLHRLREQFEVVHVCDLSQKLAAQVATEWGVPRTCVNVEVLLADPEVDAVLLLTPGTHADLTRRALRAGKHVLAEKPFAHTIAECLELDRLAGESERVLQVAYMKMYDPILGRARAELEELGEIRLVRVTVLHPDDDPQFAHQRYLRFDDVPASSIEPALRYEADRLDEALGAVGEPFRSIYSNVFQGSTCHEIALLRGLFGERPLTFTHAQIGECKVGEKLAEPPQIQALGRLGDAQLSLSWNWLPDFPEYFEEIAVFGTAGRLWVTMPGPYLRDHRATLTVERMAIAETSSQTFHSDHDTAFVHELSDFYAAVTDGGPVRSTAAGAAYDVAALEGLTAALARGFGSEVGGEAGAVGA